MDRGSSDPVERIDAALKQWRQGDVALEEHWFIHAGDPEAPLTPAASEHPESGLQGLVSEVDGLVIVTQTCDIVRSCATRPYIEVCPLVGVEADELRDVTRGRRPSRAYIPGIADSKLVADLDRTMTVEKSLVASWSRTAGCSTDEQARELARALARKRERFAFPDDFTTLVKKLRNRLTDKHDRDSDEGRALRALREIRVAASPGWTAARIELFFYFVREGDSDDTADARWPDWRQVWLNYLQPRGRYHRVEGIVTTLEEMTASDYVHSDLIDLDHLSSSSGE